MSVALATPPLEAAWDRVRCRLRAEIGAEAFTHWCSGLKPDSLQGGTLRLSVPTLFLRRHLETHYAAPLLAATKAELADVNRVVLRVRQPQARPALSLVSPDEIAPAPVYDASAGRADLDGSPLDPRFTFASFEVGPANRLAHAAALQVAESVVGQTQNYNPLYLHAKAGLGKTHLLQAIAREVARRKPAAKVHYFTAAHFLRTIAMALRPDAPAAFLEDVRPTDVLLLDDIGFLQGRIFESEHCQTLSALIDGGTQVVVAADRPPVRLESCDCHVRSRLSGGLVVEIGRLDRGVRYNILKRRIAEKMERDQGFAISEPVVAYLATQISGGGRELEGAITRLHTEHQLTAQPISVETAERIIGDLVHAREPRRVKIDDILSVIMKHFGVSRVDLLSSRRDRAVTRPRQIGMYLARLLTSRSLPEIGCRFGGKDHTTVLHAVRKITELRVTDAAVAADVAALIQDIQSH